MCYEQKDVLQHNALDRDQNTMIVTLEGEDHNHGFVSLDETRAVDTFKDTKLRM